MTELPPHLPLPTSSHVAHGGLCLRGVSQPEGPTQVGPAQPEGRQPLHPTRAREASGRGEALADMGVSVCYFLTAGSEVGYR